MGPFRRFKIHWEEFGRRGQDDRRRLSHCGASASSASDFSHADAASLPADEPRGLDQPMPYAEHAGSHTPKAATRQGAARTFRERRSHKGQPSGGERLAAVYTLNRVLDGDALGMKSTGQRKGRRHHGAPD
jgi:hypothetical protein